MGDKNPPLPAPATDVRADSPTSNGVLRGLGEPVTYTTTPTDRGDYGPQQTNTNDDMKGKAKEKFMTE